MKFINLDFDLEENNLQPASRLFWVHLTQKSEPIGEDRPSMTFDLALDLLPVPGATRVRILTFPGSLIDLQEDSMKVKHHSFHIFGFICHPLLCVSLFPDIRTLSHAHIQNPSTSEGLLNLDKRSVKKNERRVNYLFVSPD